MVEGELAWQARKEHIAPLRFYLVFLCLASTDSNRIFSCLFHFFKDSDLKYKRGEREQERESELLSTPALWTLRFCFSDQ